MFPCSAIRGVCITGFIVNFNIHPAPKLCESQWSEDWVTNFVAIKREVSFIEFARQLSNAIRRKQVVSKKKK